MTGYIVNAIRTTQIEQMLDTIPNTSYKAIFSDDLLPEVYQNLNKFILVYRVGPITPSDIQKIVYRVSCRQILKSDAEKLARLVYEVLNRTLANEGKPIYSKCTIHRAIPDENIYHVPVDVEIYNA
jgi:hypothetical protein